MKNYTFKYPTQALVAQSEKGSRPRAGTPVDGRLDSNALQLESSVILPERPGDSKRRAHVKKFKAALANCPPPGAGVHAWTLATANRAAAAGIDPEQAIELITAAMTRTPSPASEVLDTVQKAYTERGAHVGGLEAVVFQSKPNPAPLSASEFVQRGAGATEADLLAASPVHIGWGDDRWLSACALLRAAFLPGELVYCGFENGGSVLERDDWIYRFANHEYLPPLFCPNPLKAGGGVSAAGKTSIRCDDAVSVFRHAVAEFDGLSLADQILFWMGWGLDAVTAVTFSGSKSLHTLLRVDCTSREEWDRGVKNGLFRQRLIPLGCDGACKNPSRLTRLAGACRPDNGGAVQRLLFVREELA